MQEVAQATMTYEHFPEVMTMLWKRMLQDNRKNWRRTYKVSFFLLFMYPKVLLLNFRLKTIYNE